MNFKICVEYVQKLEMKTIDRFYYIDRIYLYILKEVSLI